VPVEWSERSTAPTATDAGEQIPTIVAAPALEAFQTTYVDPGMSFQYAPSGVEDVTPDQIIDGLAPTECVDQGRQDYSDSVFTGRQQYWLCQDTSLVVIVAASPDANPSAKVAVTVQAVTDADLKALDEVLLSFNVVA
jgi:hypothetical protein